MGTGRVALMGGNRAGGQGFEWRELGVLIPEAGLLRVHAARTARATRLLSGRPVAALNASTADLYSDLLY